MNSTDPPGEEARPVAQTLSTEERTGGGQRRLLSAWIGQERISERCPIGPKIRVIRYASDETIPEISRRHIRVVLSVTHLMCPS
jgi:hypothetical protein